jgi:hypothetical protein
LLTMGSERAVFARCLTRRSIWGDCGLGAFAKILFFNGCAKDWSRREGVGKRAARREPGSRLTRAGWERASGVAELVRNDMKKLARQFVSIDYHQPLPNWKRSDGRAMRSRVRGSAWGKAIRKGVCRMSV